MESTEVNWLRDSIEFRLVSELCHQCCNRLAPPTSGKAKGTSRRQNKAWALGIELRKTLRRPSDLDLLLGLDPTDDDEDIREAQGVLELLCAAINNISEPIQNPTSAPQQGQKLKYERFENLLQRLKTSDTRQQIEVISGPSLTPYRRLFVSPQAGNSESVTKALKELNEILDYVAEPNANLTDIPGAAATEANLATSWTETPPQPLPQGLVRNGVQRCFRHAEVAIKAICSKLSKCEYRATKAHDILIQLPAVEHITPPNGRSPGLELELFLSVCPDSSGWQEAKVIRQSSKHGSSYSSICSAVQEALALGASLNLYIQDQLTGIVENDFQIPSVEPMDCGKSKPKKSRTLHKMLCSKTLRRHSSISSFRISATVHIVSADERKTLAVQVIFGLVMCLRYGCIAATWDSKKVYILAAEDEHQQLAAFPHVLCVEGDPRTMWFNLPGPKEPLNTTSAPKAFKGMAKALLEIGFGECLDDYSEEDIWKIVNNMTGGQGVRGSTNNSQVDTIDLIPYAAAAKSCLLFSLLYRKEVNRMSMSGGSVDPWAIVEEIVYREIIAKLDNNCVRDAPIGSMGSVLEARSRAQETLVAKIHTRACIDVARRIVVDMQPTQQPVVRLFDGSKLGGKIGGENDQGNSFFLKLDNFRAKFEHYLSERSNSITSPRPVRVAILDTGIDMNNAGIDFDGTHMKKDWCINFVHDLLNPSAPLDPSAFHDRDGHGTHCASLLRKVAPDAEIYVAKVFDKNQFDLTQAGNISEAIKHCVTTWNVDVISMSFGLEPPGSCASMDKWRRIKKNIEDEISRERTRLFFAAASNDGKNKARAFPSTHRDVFCIHASDSDGNSCGINPRAEKDNDNLMTLGTGICLLEDDDYVIKEGTSFATAIAAGMAASIMHLTSRTSRLEGRSRAALRARAGMQKLLMNMAGPDKNELCPYVAPWRYWKEEYWGSNPHGLEKIWCELNTEFNDFS
ncbi:hypothetical protein RB598_003769 [Gaeumannomyces tritici]